MNTWDLLTAAREWIADASGMGSPDEMTSVEVQRFINRNYPGGMSAFVRDNRPPLDPRWK